MLRLLGLFAAVAGLLLLSNSAQAPRSVAQSAPAAYTVTLMLYHPSGSASVNEQLTCGWHSLCPTTGPPGGGPALDWVPVNFSSRTTWVRTFGVTGSGSSTWVAREETYYQETPCKQMRSDIERISDWALYGMVRQYHSGGNANHNYSNIYASTAGSYNSPVAGYILPHAQDNCTNYGDHTHQFYQSGPYDSWYTKNSVSVYNTCNYGVPGQPCGSPFPIWNTWEYGIQFVTG